MRLFKQRFLLLIATAFFCNSVRAQKTVIDYKIFGSWASLQTEPKISNDGNYVTYVITNQPVGSATTFIRSAQAGWIKELAGNIACQFTADSKQYLYNQHDSLFIANTGDEKVEVISGPTSFRLVTFAGEEWLVYQVKDQLVFRNLSSGQTRAFPDVANVIWSNDHQHAVLVSNAGKGGDENLKWLDLKTFEAKSFWSGSDPTRVVYDNTGTRFAFFTETGSSKSIWYYEAGTAKAALIADSTIIGLPRNFKITDLTALGSNGKRLFFSIREQYSPPKKDGSQVGVDVWSYKDPRIQSAQLQHPRQPINYHGWIDINSKKISLLENEHLQLMTPTEDIATGNLDNVLVRVSKNDIDIGDNREWNWSPYDQFSVRILSLKTGLLTPIHQSLAGVRLITLCQLSPDGKYVIWFDPKTSNYYSYDIVTKISKELTGNIKAIWSRYEINDEPCPNYWPIGIAGFIKDQTAMLVYDQNDIFQIDYSGKQAPLCLTGYKGKQQDYTFKITTNEGDTFTGHQTLLVDAFNRTTKHDGFCKIQIGTQQAPQMLTEGPYLYDGPTETNPVDAFSPVKAKNKDIYLVRRMSATESPNLYFTTDFKNLQPLTDIHPEKQVNWLTTELVTFKTLDGQTDQGILYKPENFDPQKKYPLIINYYEKKSNALNAFEQPGYTDSEINIAYFTSNGYLVFTPDIHFKIGFPGRSSYNCVVAAAQLLAKRPYVDAKHMGIQGHSFGGFQTNYIVAHSHLFAAAMSSSGMSDYVSIYNTLLNGGGSRQGQYEWTRDRMGVDLWQNKAGYIENSPVLEADQITTPLLMMANKNDGNVSPQQGIELFLSLRRLGKKAWMLQYDEGGHFAPSGAGSADYTTRIKQFFDYYLKGFAPPVWMTKGIPAELKQVDSGLETDTTAATP